VNLADRADRPVGVIGGVGPLATAYFVQRVVQRTRAERDQDHVDMVVLNHATIPDRTDYVLGRSQADPGPVLARDARRLEEFGVSFLVMPCNTAHYFTQQVLDAISTPFVSIVDVTVAAARERVPDLRTVGLLATAGHGAQRVGVGRLVDRGASVVVLGCTELSVAAVDHDLLDEPPFLDSMDELVRATIEAAGHEVR
jgi:aspartate racemase